MGDNFAVCTVLRSLMLILCDRVENENPACIDRQHMSFFVSDHVHADQSHTASDILATLG